MKRTWGFRNLPKKGPFIIASKHIGSLDGFFIIAAITSKLNKKLHFIASIKPWGRIWKYHIAQKWGGAIHFDKNNRAQCLVEAREYLEKGEIVGLFPEGYLDEYAVNHKPRTGAARLALWTKVPIVPVGLKYKITVENDVPVLYQFWKSVINSFKNPHSLVINFGKPFELSEYYEKEITKEILVEATDKIINKIEALTNIKNINK